MWVLDRQSGHGSATLLHVCLKGHSTVRCDRRKKKQKTMPDSLPENQTNSAVPLSRLPSDQPREDQISGGHTEKNSMVGGPKVGLGVWKHTARSPRSVDMRLFKSEFGDDSPLWISHEVSSGLFQS